MKRVIFVLSLLATASCDCDAICQANRESSKFFSGLVTDKEVVEYLNAAKGEATHTQIVINFIIWGTKNQQHFANVITDEALSATVGIKALHEIGEKSLSDKFCSTLEKDQYEKIFVDLLGYEARFTEHLKFSQCDNL